MSSKGVMNEGYTATLLGMRGDPAVSEIVIVARDLELARYLDVGIHLQHISAARSVELIRQAKRDGVRVTAEACPHHFSLTEEAVKTFDPNTKVNPPLRAAADVAALKEGLRDGTIDCIATDHAPHTVEDKEMGFDLAPFGMIGLETALGAGHDRAGRPRGLDPAAAGRPDVGGPGADHGADDQGHGRRGPGTRT